MNLKIIKIMCVFLVFMIICSPIHTFAGSDGSPEGYDSWESFLLGETSATTEDVGEVSKIYPSISQMKLIDSENGFEFYYYEKDLVLCIRDILTGALWFNIMDQKITESNTIENSDSRCLFNVTVSDENNSVTTYNILSSEKLNGGVKGEIVDKKIIMHVSPNDSGVSFDAEFSFEDGQLSCFIPSSTIKESKSSKLISISVIPSFGAAAVNENGYIAFCDGSGALVDFSGMNSSVRTKYSYNVWGNSSEDIDTKINNKSLGIHTITMPVFGIKHNDGGVVCFVSDGEANTSLNIIYDKFYSTYFTMNYRKFYSTSYNFTGNVFDKKDVSILSKESISKKNYKICWSILSGNNNTYSKMAVKYRDNLIKTNVLTKKEVQNNIPVSLEIFEGIKKSTILGNKVISLTSYKDVLNIINDLNSKGVKALDINLVGWADGGYTQNPTLQKSDKTNGSEKELNSIQELCKKNKFSLYKSCQYVMGNYESGKFNKKNDVIRDCIKQPLLNENKTISILLPENVILPSIKKWINNKQNGICLLDFGETIPSGFSMNSEISINNSYSIYKKIMKMIYDSGKTNLAVQGANSYVLPYANRIYDIPDNDSGYYENSKSIPFYQIVVHGFIQYSSTAINRASDLTMQKLKCIETGSIPHFFITQKSSTLFKDTEYNKVFSSKYSDFSDLIISIYKEMNKDVQNISNETINNHEYITDSVIKVEYSNGYCFYINYGSKAYILNSFTINPMDYIVVKEK